MKKVLDELKNRRAELLYHLCEDESVYHPQVVCNLVSELRGIIKIIKLIEETEKNERERKTNN